MKNVNNSKIIRKYQTSDLEKFLDCLLNKDVFHSLNSGLGTEKEIEIWRSDKSDYIKIFNEAIRGYTKPNPFSVGFAIVYSGAMVGGIHCTEITEYEGLKNGEISYWLKKDYWGKGLATQALQDFSVRMFEDYGLNYLSARISKTNISSQKVLEKNGFVLEEILEDDRKAYFLDNYFI